MVSMSLFGAKSKSMCTEDIILFGVIAKMLWTFIEKIIQSLDWNDIMWVYAATAAVASTVSIHSDCKNAPSLIWNYHS